MDNKNKASSYDAITAVIQFADGGYDGYFEVESGVVSGYGKNLTELKKSLEDGLADLIVEAEDDSYDAEYINFLKSTEIKFSIDVKMLFKIFSTINQTEFAKRINMNRSQLNLFATGKRNPSHESSMAILNGIREIGHEYLQI